MPINNMPSPSPQEPQMLQQQTDTQPQFNQDALVGLVQNAVQGVIDQNRAQAQRERQQAEQQRQAAVKSQGLQADPVFQTVAPVIAPAIQQVALKADNALDAVTFYQSHPEAAKYRQEVEALTANAIAQGRPTDRESLWFYFRGNPANAKRLQDDYDAQQKMIAQMSATVGAGAVGRGDGSVLTFKPDTPLQEMRDALKGVSF